VTPDEQRADVLERLAAAKAHKAEAVAALDDELQQLVDEARSLRLTWREIAEVLGVTRAHAQLQYTPEARARKREQERQRRKG
jgi:hypothetical protein